MLAASSFFPFLPNNHPSEVEAEAIFLLMRGSPHLRCPFVPDEDWDMESDESPARKLKGSLNPPLDATACNTTS